MRVANPVCVVAHIANGLNAKEAAGGDSPDEQQSGEQAASVRQRTELVRTCFHNERPSVVKRTAGHGVLSFTFLEIFVMKFNHNLFKVLPALALVSLLGACAGMTQQEKGTATGAAVGGVAGAVLGGGVLGTAAGAAVGGVVGHEVTKPKN